MLFGSGAATCGGWRGFDGERLGRGEGRLGEDGTDGVGSGRGSEQCNAGALVGVFDSEPRVGMDLSVVWIWVRRSVRLFRSVVGGRRSVVQTAGRWSVGRWVHRVKLVMERGSREQDGRGPLLVATAQLTAAKAKRLGQGRKGPTTLRMRPKWMKFRASREKTG